jgi:hypothetical protein
MATWTQDRLSEFEDMLLEWPGTIVFNGVTYDALCDPQTSQRVMQDGPFSGIRPTIFAIRKTDFASSKMNNRSFFSSDGKNYQVTAIIEDPNEPSVQIRADQKQ